MHHGLLQIISKAPSRFLTCSSCGASFLLPFSVPGLHKRECMR